MVGNSPFKKRLRFFRKIFFWTRVVTLLLLVVLASQLVLWSHRYDPRFYKFLGTAPGKALSEIMEWPNLYNRMGTEKALEDYSDEERRWKQNIESRLQLSWPTHTLHLQDGNSLNVRILGATSSHLQIREHFGGQGRLDRHLDKSEIRKISSFQEPIPDVSLRDIHFQMEHPEFTITYSGNYTVLSDAPYFQIASSVEALEHLHSQFLEIFPSLIRYPENRKDLQVLFFSNEKDYREHQRKSAPGMDSSVGYYSPLEDRMVVFNQQYSERANKIRKGVQSDIETLLQRATTDAQRKHVQRMQQHAEKQIRYRADMDTLATLRHEGVHHLLYTYGVHSWIHTENAWLIEGMACYFEAVIPGGPDRNYSESLFRLLMQGRVPTVGELTAVRKPENFESNLPLVRSHESYALSWSLIHFCMLEENREAFFQYLREVQSPENISELMQQPRAGLLAEHLELSLKDLNALWHQHIQLLATGKKPA